MLVARLQIRGGGGGPSKRGAGKAASSGASLPGAVLSSKEGVVATVWAEVYCGTADAGRWVHVDVLNGYVDQPNMVDGASARKAPLCYVIACEHGRARDVTQRYAASMPSVLRNRDEEWWRRVTAYLHAQPLRLDGGGGGGAPAVKAEAEVIVLDSDDDDAEEEEGGPALCTRVGGRAAAGEEQAARAAAAGGVPDQASSLRAAAGKGPRIIDARYSHQRGTQDHPLGAHAAQAASAAEQKPGSSTAALRPQQASAAATAATASAAGPLRAASAPAAANLQKAGGGRQGDKTAALRAAREEAELSHRALSQLHGLPTSIDGFKTHPLYILKRHITKYEVRPGRAWQHIAYACHSPSMPSLLCLW